MTDYVLVPTKKTSTLEEAWREGWQACRDSEYSGQEAEDWAWGKSQTNAQVIDIEQAPKAPQRQWIGLTEEEEEEAWCQAPTTTETWQRIEKKLQEKNQREWIDLTEEEFRQIMIDVYNIDINAPGQSSDDNLLWHAISKKLKEKNT